MVITASLSLADIPATARLWRQRRVEFSLSVTFAGVALLGVLPGIGIAGGLLILNVFRRVGWPHQTTLGLVDGVAGYHDVPSYPDAGRLPGLVISRFDAPLFFANAKTFPDEITRVARTEPPAHWILSPPSRSPTSTSPGPTSCSTSTARSTIAARAWSSPN